MFVCREQSRCRLASAFMWPPSAHGLHIMPRHPIKLMSHAEFTEAVGPGPNRCRSNYRDTRAQATFIVYVNLNLLCPTVCIAKRSCDLYQTSVEFILTFKECKSYNAYRGYISSKYDANRNFTLTCDISVDN